MTLTDFEAIILVYFRSRNFSIPVIREVLALKIPHLTASAQGDLNARLRTVLRRNVEDGHADMKPSGGAWNLSAVDDFVRRKGRVLRDPFQLTRIGRAEQEIIDQHADNARREHRRESQGVAARRHAMEQMGARTRDVRNHDLGRGEGIGGFTPINRRPGYDSRAPGSAISSRHDTQPASQGSLVIQRREPQPSRSDHRSGRSDGRTGDYPWSTPRDYRDEAGRRSASPRQRPQIQPVGSGTSKPRDPTGRNVFGL